jgi:hypothetical protein
MYAILDGAAAIAFSLKENAIASQRHPVFSVNRLGSADWFGEKLEH